MRMNLEVQHHSDPQNSKGGLILNRDLEQSRKLRFCHQDLPKPTSRGSGIFARNQHNDHEDSSDSSNEVIKRINYYNFILIFEALIFTRFVVFQILIEPKQKRVKVEMKRPRLIDSDTE